MRATAQAMPRGALAMRFVACVGDEVTREAVGRAISRLQWTAVRVQDGGLAAAQDLLRAGERPSLLLVDLSEFDDPAAAIADLRQLCGTTTRLIVIGGVNDVALYRQALSLGVADYLVKPISADMLHDALAASPGAAQSAPAATEDARLCAVIGARGGVGTTTVAAGIGWCLAHELKQRTVLVDLDLQFGNLALSLDLEPGRGLREALEHPERIDSLLLASAMASESERLRVLAGEESLSDSLHFEDEAATPLVTTLRQDFACIVVDLPRRLDGMTQQLLTVASSIALVTDLSLTSLRDTLRLLDAIKALDAKAQPVLIANQVGAGHRGEISRGEFERGAGASIDFVVPFDAKAAQAMARLGKALPAVPAGRKAASELKRFAERLAGPPPAKPKARFFGSFFG